MNFKNFALITLILLTACSSAPSESLKTSADRSPASEAKTDADIRKDIAEGSVSVTELTGRSGGSGTIVYSSKRASLVLTNSHVCEVVKTAGTVNTPDGKRHLVVNYRPSRLHDLCLIEVAADLKHSVQLAKEPPRTLTVSYVAGHPHLLPIILNQGHFSEKMIIHVMTGFRPCTPEEFNSTNLGGLCHFLGMIPIVKTYQSAVLSNLIQPGSSGSGVFNADGELAGVVFAGSGDLSYGFAVPYEYVIDFLVRESLSVTPIEPTMAVDLSGASANKKLKSIEEKYETYCEQHTNKCPILNSDLIERK